MGADAETAGDELGAGVSTTMNTLFAPDDGLAVKNVSVVIVGPEYGMVVDPVVTATSPLGLVAGVAIKVAPGPDPVAGNVRDVTAVPLKKKN